MKLLDFNSFINQDRQKTKPVNEHLWSGIIKRSETGDVRKEDIVICQNTDDIRKGVQNIIDRIHPKEGDTIDLNGIDVSEVDNMLGLFQDDQFTKYNYNVSKWDVSKVKNMGHMFSSCKNFKCDLSGWDVSNVEDMSNMFSNCKNFNCDLSRWNVSSVTNMDDMFGGCTNFNSDLSNWDVSNVDNMSYMFANCEDFNSDLSRWDVSKVTDMSGMFNVCKNFNCDLSGWDVSKVTDTYWMFSDCKNFNCDLSRWDVSKVKRMAGMFYGCKKLNCDLSQWQLKDINFSVFYGCDSLDEKNLPEGYGKLDWVWTYQLDFNELVKHWIIFDLFDYKKLDHSDASFQTDSIIELFKDWCDIKYIDVYCLYYEEDFDERIPGETYRYQGYRYYQLCGNTLDYDEEIVKNAYNKIIEFSKNNSAIQDLEKYLTYDVFLKKLKYCAEEKFYDKDGELN